MRAAAQTPQPAPTCPLVNIERFAPPRGGKFWPSSTSQLEGQTIAGLAISDFVHHVPDRHYNGTGKFDLDSWAHAAWTRIRTCPVDDRTTVESVLGRPQFTSPIQVLKDLIGLALAARERRAELLRQIEDLNELEHAFSDRTHDAR